MRYNNKLPKAVIISNDSALQKGLETSQPTKKNLLSVILSSDLLNISPRIEADAYIFDIEHFNDDMNNMISHITNLKRSIFNKPLILIGEKFHLNEILDQGNIKDLVSKTIDKPLSNGQLLSAINACDFAKKPRFGFLKLLH